MPQIKGVLTGNLAWSLGKEIGLDPFFKLWVVTQAGNEINLVGGKPALAKEIEIQMYVCPYQVRMNYLVNFCFRVFNVWMHVGL